jgi:hypothetical protein
MTLLGFIILKAKYAVKKGAKRPKIIAIAT